MNLPALLRRVTLFLLLIAGSHAHSYELPSLGDASSSIVSAQEEQITGQNWLRAFRRQAPISDDPLLYSYTYDLIQQLAFHSPLENKNFHLVMVASQDFNAFAVPGNVVGINLGLFRYANTEDQLAAVISHELAHLSQRHYARSVAYQKSQRIATLAALLGSLLVMAAGDSESGIAALTATQAAAIDSQLKYSRTQEEEADRIGMQTMANAGMNPEAIAHMFQHMLAETRYRSDLREFDFLLTHPLAENRISDALNKARQYPKRNDRDSLQFHLMKARAHALAEKGSNQSQIHFRNLVEHGKYPAAGLYGLALALLEAQDTSRAEPVIDRLYQEYPHIIAFIILKAELLQQQNNTVAAERLIAEALQLSPRNYPLTMTAAQLFLKNNKPQEAVNVMRQLVASSKPDTPDVWYLLAEVEGLSGNIPEVHLARAEYFVRVGALTQGQRHLHLALPLLEKNPQARSRAQLRINEIEKMKQEQQF